MSQSEVFCILPWIHLHVWPDGRVLPCCASDSNKPVAHLNQQSLQEAWNSPELRGLRQKMLQGQKSSHCERCYSLEKSGGGESLRQVMLREFAHHLDRVKDTAGDGSIPAGGPMAYLDIRFSNVCNFKCRTCGPELSNAWHEDHVRLFGPTRHPRLIKLSNMTDFWKQLEPHLLEVEMAQLAGGEPLLSEEHLALLEYWIAKSHTHVRLEYTTNLSQLQIQGRKLLDLWQHFPNIKIRASLDASGARAEYLRHGTKWEQIVSNVRQLKELLPQAELVIVPTISLFNVWHYPDFIQEWNDADLAHPGQFIPSVLTDPEYMSIEQLPNHWRGPLLERYLSAREWAVTQALARKLSLSKIKRAYDVVIKFLQRPSSEQNLNRFFERASLLDKIRDEDWRKTFPELTPWN